MNIAVHAAVDVAASLGIQTHAPAVLQETNNTVVWLQPAEIIAKVATRPDAQEGLRIEHAVATQLADLRAEAARPFPGTGPVVHASTGFVVTLWQRADGMSQAPVDGRELSASLQRLHTALARTQTDLPPFHLGLSRARVALENDAFMGALPADERSFLRQVFDEALERLTGYAWAEHRLHGEPHGGNRLLTHDGVVWIDFESCCTGPREWDLAFLSDETLEFIPGFERPLLELLRMLNSARTATWCWAMARFPEMRWHGETHLAALHAAAD